jgi:hypothetical protein
MSYYPRFLGDEELPDERPLAWSRERHRKRLEQLREHVLLAHGVLDRDDALYVFNLALELISENEKLCDPRRDRPGV